MSPRTADEVTVFEDPSKSKVPTPPWWASPFYDLKNFVIDGAHYYKNNPSRIKSEMLSGITISILKVPESVAFSYVAGVHPLQGLYGSFFMGIITGFLGGRPGMISGCAGALAVVIYIIMTDAGPFGDKCPQERREYLFFTMVLTGILQLLCGLCRCAVLVKLIPKTAFLGFFNGLAVVIFTSQLNTFKKAESAVSAGAGMGCAKVDFGFIPDQKWYQIHETTTWLMLVHVVVVMGIMELMPRLPTFTIPKIKLEIIPARIIPPSLLGLFLVMGIEWGIYRQVGLSTPVVYDVSRIKGALPTFHIPDVPWGEWETWSKCLPTACALCAIGLVESVLTLQAVDQVLDEETSIPMKNQECLAQGLANLVSGFFMAMGGDAMIGQSMINVLNGAQGRLSAVTDASFLMIYIVALSPFIEAVPTAGLAGILFVVVIHTFNWPSLSIIIRRALPAYMCATIVIVTVLSVLTNLAIGIGVGVLWECVWYTWMQKDVVKVQRFDKSEETTYRIAGDVFFANVTDVNGHFDPSRDAKKAVICLANARILDYSALFMLNALGRRYDLLGKELHVDMKAEDFERYLAISDEPLSSGNSVSKRLRRWFPTHATKALEGRVKQHELLPFKFQAFVEEATDWKRSKLQDADEESACIDARPGSKGPRKSVENAWQPPVERAFSKDVPDTSKTA
eukprot:TRINITY_DN23545_c0_g1_i1.p1 TRINITY_DN23545_c0_g1~~TRINITY_DN23545_c0_g1_i1.p1  ORF type:complete len:680 (+),score=108.10 TRINITY_DN23545_c0_g1_i1:54-2093(+)